MAFKGIRIVNKTGIVRDTEVFDSVTGEKIHGIYALEFLPLVLGETIKAKLSVHVREMDVVSEKSKCKDANQFDEPRQSQEDYKGLV